MGVHIIRIRVSYSVYWGPPVGAITESGCFISGLRVWALGLGLRERGALFFF